MLELKAETNAELVTAYLFKHTDLEITFPVNFTALKPNMEPERLSLKEIMRYFLDFRHEITTKRLNFDLRILKARLHILTAFEKLYDDLDTAIKIIRKAKSREDAAEKLKKHFKFDDEQVKAILEMQLYKLVGLEIERILKEKAEKTKLKKDIEAILASQKKIWAPHQDRAARDQGKVRRQAQVRDEGRRRRGILPGGLHRPRGHDRDPDEDGLDPPRQDRGREPPVQGRRRAARAPAGEHAGTTSRSSRRPARST